MRNFSATFWTVGKAFMDRAGIAGSEVLEEARFEFRSMGFNYIGAALYVCKRCWDFWLRPKGFWFEEPPSPRGVFIFRRSGRITSERYSSATLLASILIQIFNCVNSESRAPLLSLRDKRVTSSCLWLQRSFGKFTPTLQSCTCRCQ